jgi:amino acid permease
MSPAGSMVALANSIVGCGFLSLPFALHLCGYATGCAAVVAAMALSSASLGILVRCARL